MKQITQYFLEGENQTLKIIRLDSSYEAGCGVYSDQFQSGY